MNIALMAHDNKKELMVQFCTAYAGILSRHTLCATSVTGKMVSEAIGLPIHLFMARIHGGAEQIGARIAYNEIDMVLYFCDPNNPQYNESPQQKAHAYYIYVRNRPGNVYRYCKHNQ